MTMALRTPTVIALVVVLSAAVASPPASASRAALRRTVASSGGGDGSGSIGRVSLHNGNGKRNVNTSTILSPTVNRGGLQIANTDTAGTTITKVNAHKNKFCCSHRHRHRRRR
ncbi:MAG: hypothetical protein ACJ72W_28095 [Actinoallomurus sp.]